MTPNYSLAATPYPYAAVATQLEPDQRDHLAGRCLFLQRAEAAPAVFRWEIEAFLKRR